MDAYEFINSKDVREYLAKPELPAHARPMRVSCVAEQETHAGAKA